MKFLLFLLISMFSFNVFAHTDCAMHLTEEQVKAEFEYRKTLKTLDKLPLSGAKKLDGFITIPVKVHIINDTNGSNNYNLLTLYTQFCELNEIYKSAGFYFYLLPDINFVVDNDFIRRGSTVPESELYSFFGNMMYRYYHYGALNVYYTLGTGLCGMAPFPSMTSIFDGRTGLLMEASNSCSGVGKKTLAHELGHHFGLLHTFQGYDSRDARYHEYVSREAGSRNCETAGDGFCDTPADVLDFTCPYTGSHTDLRGDRYNPDVTLIMSYHADNCQYKFSDQEIAYMNEVIRTDTSRTVYLKNQIETFRETPTTELFSPVNEASVYVNANTVFTWKEAPDADAYIFTVTSGSGSLKYQAIVKDTTSYEMVFPNSDRGLTLYWTVTPVSKEIPCLVTTERSRFKVTTQPTNVKDFETSQITVYPNPVKNAEFLTIQLGDQSIFKNKNVSLRWVSVNGQIVHESMAEVIHSNIQVKISNEIPSGTYLLNLIDEDDTYTTKIVIQ